MKLFLAVLALIAPPTIQAGEPDPFGIKLPNGDSLAFVLRIANWGKPAYADIGTASPVLTPRLPLDSSMRYGSFGPNSPVMRDARESNKKLFSVGRIGLSDWQMVVKFSRKNPRLQFSHGGDFGRETYRFELKRDPVFDKPQYWVSYEVLF